MRQYLDKPIEAEKIEAIQECIDRCNREVQHPQKKTIADVAEDRSTTRSFPDWFVRGVEAALLAPTAVNQQKFKFFLYDDHCVEAVAKFSLIGYAHLDLGIAKYHFEVGAGEDFDWI